MEGSSWMWNSIVFAHATVRESFLFFFSSRRRHTRFDCDWSSDVCSSDLTSDELVAPVVRTAIHQADPHLVTVNIESAEWGQEWRIAPMRVNAFVLGALAMRSEERRVGKECRSRWSPYH